MKVLFLFLGILTVTDLYGQQEAAYLDSMITDVRNTTKALSLKFDAISEQYDAAVASNAGDHILDSLKDAMTIVQDELSQYAGRPRYITLHFIATHPDSYVSAKELRNFVQAIPLDSVQTLYNNLSPSVKKSTYGIQVGKDIRRIIAVSPGGIAPDFSATDIHHKPLRLYAFRGKYVLLDFWASWCVPCREGNPHLIALYNKYKITIIGIADNEKQPDVWRKAVAKDKIDIWYHVLKGHINELYGIQSLPTKILINKEGVVIGRYGEEDTAALDKQLADLHL